MLSYGHLVYDFGTVKNRETEKKEPNRPGTESGTETGTVPSLLWAGNSSNVFPIKSGGGCMFSLPGRLWMRGRVHATFTPDNMGKTLGFCRVGKIPSIKLSLLEG